jgi:hypothetical protein
VPAPFRVLFAAATLAVTAVALSGCAGKACCRGFPGPCITCG